MREIKFSAYDATSKSIIEDYAHIGQYGELKVTIFHSLAYGKTCPNLTLLQYTSLKDKKGCEIREDDIVEHRFYNGYMRKTLSVLFKVIFHEGAFQQQYLNSNENEITIWYDWDELEIIGNIYKNPELSINKEDD